MDSAKRTWRGGSSELLKGTRISLYCGRGANPFSLQRVVFLTKQINADNTSTHYTTITIQRGRGHSRVKTLSATN